MSQGRDESLIAAALESDRGRPAVCTVVGPAGIGKTELLRRIRRRWRADDRRVVRIVGSELERHVALGAVEQLLGQLDSTVEPAGAATPSSEANAERRVASTVLRALDQLADDGTLVIVDDAHWLDETSRRIFDFALRRLDDEAPATLIAERPGPTLASVGERIMVAGLSPEESLEIVDEVRSDSVDEASVLHELAGGNPLALHELIAAGSGRADDRERLERALIRRRIDQLDRDAQLAVALVARRRAGDDLDAAWANLRATHPAARESLIDALQTATDAGLTAAGTGHPTFRHPEYRAIASVAVDGTTQRTISAALAATTNDADSAAWHRADASAGLDDEVAALLAATGRRNAERGVPIEAARAFEAAAANAVDPVTVIDRRLDAAECWWLAGEPTDVARVTADCDELPVDQLRRLRVRRLHRAAVGWHGQVGATIRGFLDDAELAAEFSVDDASSFRLAAFIEACHAGRIDLAVEIAEMLTAGLDDDAAESWSGASAVCTAFAAMLAGRTRGDDDPHHAILAFAAALDPRKLETPALNLLQVAGYALMVLERWDDAADSLRALATEERARGATVMTDFTEATQAELDRRRGRWASAVSRCTDVADIDPDHLGAGPAWQRAIRARILACQGDPAALDFAAAVHDEAGPVGMVSITGAADVARATHLLVRGAPDDAADLMEALERQVVGGGALESGVLWHELDAIEAFVASDRLDALGRLTDRLEHHAEVTGRSWSVTCGRLGRWLLDGSGAPAALLASDSSLDDTFEAARIELLVAERLEARGHATTVTADLGALTRLRARMARFAAQPFVDRCDRLIALQNSGAVDDRPAGGSGPIRTETGATSDLSVLTELTPAELRVAVSVAGGRTNAEAADELFLSVRTVEAHLRSIFRKLQIRNRVELATAMSGHVSE